MSSDGKGIGEHVERLRPLSFETGTSRENAGHGKDLNDGHNAGHATNTAFACAQFSSRSALPFQPPLIL